MALACQVDSYCKEYTTKVHSCVEVSSRPKKPTGKSESGSPATDVRCYEVILEDTILFPEGGGQPDDRGTIGDVPVRRVFRRGAQAVHLVDVPIEAGGSVQLSVDWERRYDHMQQHTGQHLITAIAESAYDFKTTSWNLGERISFVELDTPTITVQQMELIEYDCNAKIRDRVPVNVVLYEQGSDDLHDVRSRLLPGDHIGPIRVVSIQGVDENTCCGTHVSNLSHLQVIKLMYVEKGKKDKSNLFFLVGDRVLRFVAESVLKDKQLTTILGGGPAQHVSLAEKMQKALKVSQKNEVSFMRNVASLEANRFLTVEPRPKIFSLHRFTILQIAEGTSQKKGCDANADFMAVIAKEINDEDVLLFLTVGEDKGAGHILMSGQPKLLAELGPKVLEILDGKGSGKGSRFSGKVKNLSRRSEAEKFLKEALNIE